MSLRFSKMHGLGNDFVIVDCRERPLALDAAAIRRLGDRHFGVGFDQLLTIERARDAACAFAYGIWNTDGSRAGQCGNGVRCVARWLVRAGALARRRDCAWKARPVRSRSNCSTTAACAPTWASRASRRRRFRSSPRGA